MPTGQEFGTLHLPHSIPDGISSVTEWTDCTVNIILVAAALVLFLIAVLNVIRIFPDLQLCITKPHGPAAFEHSVHKSRSRNFIAVLFIPAAAVLIDRLNLYRPSFLAPIPPEFSVAAMAGVLVLFRIVRNIFFSFTRKLRLRSDDAAALKNIELSVFVFLATFLMPVTTLLLIAGVDEKVLRSAVYIILGIGFFISLVRSGQILAGQYGFFTTLFLLMAIEILPAAMLIVPAVLL